MRGFGTSLGLSQHPLPSFCLAKKELFILTNSPVVSRIYPHAPPLSL